MIHKERRRRHDEGGFKSPTYPLIHSPLFSPSPVKPSSAAAPHLSLPPPNSSSYACSIASGTPSPGPPSPFSQYDSAIAHLTLVGDVKNKVVLLMDDMADTCNTLIKASIVCMHHGASRVYALVSHGIFSGDALERLSNAPIHEIITSHSVPISEDQLRLYPKLRVLDISALFSEAIRRIHYGESVSFLFDRVPI